MSVWIKTAERMPQQTDCDEKGAVWVWDGLCVVPKHASRVNPDDFPLWQPRPARRRPRMPEPLQ